jgi:hypothetical protein
MLERRFFSKLLGAQSTQKNRETREPPFAIHGFRSYAAGSSTVFIALVRRALEEELQRKLNLPWGVVRTGHYHLAERRTYRASSNLISGRYLVGCGVVVLVVRNEIARSVCQIKDLRAELQALFFPL